MTPGKTLFGWAVHAQQTSPCIQRQAQALRALYPTVALPLFYRCFAVFGVQSGWKKGVLKAYPHTYPEPDDVNDPVRNIFGSQLAAAVPEPGTYALMVGGLLPGAAARRRGAGR